MKRPDVISLEQVLDEPVPFEFDLSFGVASLDREPLIELSPVRFEGEINRMESGFSLEGLLTYGGRLECSRCLAPYPFEGRERFSLVLYKRVPRGPGEVELEKADLDAYFYEAPEVAVTPIVEERIQLALPMKPLCSPECRGLCVQCGADLNRAPCHCVTEARDPRWEALRVLGRDGSGRRRDSPLTSFKKA